MIIRLFVVFVVLLAGYLSAQVYYIYSGRAHLDNIPAGYHYGPADANLTVVEFLDYSCPFCQEVHPTIKEAVQTDGNVKYAPFPILSASSDGSSASFLLYAAAKMGKFVEAHEYLIENNANITRDSIPIIAEDLGLDPQEFEENLNSEEVFSHVQDNHSAMLNLGNYATPTFFIGPNIRYVPEGGMPTVEDFLKMFEEARAK